nr:radical SAM protein [Helicobacter pylori]
MLLSHCLLCYTKSLNKGHKGKGSVIDSFNRVIDYIRVSVTKQCNFSCQYCMPTTPLNFFDNEELLPLDNVLEFLKIAIDEGVKKIRITGGEPLLRKGLDEFIAKLHAYNKEVALVLSTNGFLLKKMAKGLKNAGLSRVNVSLDSLKRVLKISQKDALKNTIEGIEESLKVGLKLKLNTVVVKSVNDDEILELLEYAKNRHIQIRVISRGVSRFVEHFNQLKGHQFFVKDSDMQDLHKQVSVVQNFSKQLNASGMSEESTIGGMFAGFGSLGISSFTTGAMLGGGLTMGGLAGMAVFGGLVAGPALAILGAVSADEMEKKLEDVKAYCCEIE